LVACPIDTILMQDLAADLLDARAALRAVCEAGEGLLDANRTVNIYANDEWRTSRGGLEDAIDAARKLL
jgi:hypothetical protein